MEFLSDFRKLYVRSLYEMNKTIANKEGADNVHLKLIFVHHSLL